MHGFWLGRVKGEFWEKEGGFFSPDVGVLLLLRGREGTVFLILCPACPRERERELHDWFSSSDSSGLLHGACRGSTLASRSSTYMCGGTVSGSRCVLVQTYGTRWGMSSKRERGEMCIYE